MGLPMGHECVRGVRRIGAELHTCRATGDVVGAPLGRENVGRVRQIGAELHICRTAGDFVGAS